jgi:hypothetical protein
MSLGTNSHFPDVFLADFLATGSDCLTTGSFGPEAEFFGMLAVITSVELLLSATATFGTPPEMCAGVIVCGATAFSPLSLAPLGLSLTTVPLFKAGGGFWRIVPVGTGETGQAGLARDECSQTPAITITNTHAAVPARSTGR